jgi:hypothetical protein
MGASTLVTELLIERVEGENALCTCVRDDDFFVEKLIPIASLENQFCAAAEGVNFLRLQIPPWASDACQHSAATTWVDFDLARSMLDQLKAYYANSNQRGSESLKQYLVHQDLGVTHYRNKAEAGLVEVLLADMFWPMHFAYGPFISFLGFALRECVALPIDLDRHEIKSLIAKIKNQAEVITNLSYTFGQHATDENYNHVLTSCFSLTNLYGEIEHLLLDALHQ